MARDGQFGPRMRQRALGVGRGTCALGPIRGAGQAGEASKRVLQRRIHTRRNADRPDPGENERRHQIADEDADHPVPGQGEIIGGPAALNDHQVEGEGPLEARIAQPFAADRKPCRRQGGDEHDRHQAADAVDRRQEEYQRKHADHAAHHRSCQPQADLLQGLGGSRQGDDEAGEEGRVDPRPVQQMIEQIAGHGRAGGLQRKMHMGRVGEGIGLEERACRPRGRRAGAIGGKGGNSLGQIGLDGRSPCRQVGGVKRDGRVDRIGILIENGRHGLQMGCQMLRRLQGQPGIFRPRRTVGGEADGGCRMPCPVDGIEVPTVRCPLDPRQLHPQHQLQLPFGADIQQACAPIRLPPKSGRRGPEAVRKRSREQAAG